MKLVQKLARRLRARQFMSEHLLQTGVFPEPVKVLQAIPTERIQLPENFLRMSFHQIHAGAAALAYAA